MFGDGSLSFREWARGEQLPLATFHDAVLEFLQGRKDAVLIGAHAVNAYVDQARMTEDVDLASPRAAELAEEVSLFLHGRFQIAVRVRDVWKGQEYRIYQVRKPKNRHLIDVRSIEVLPPAKRVKKVLVVTPPELLANKVMCMVGRQHKPKSFIDKADVYRVLLRFPELKTEQGAVADRLRAAKATEDVLAAWKMLVAEEILPDDDESGY